MRYGSRTLFEDATCTFLSGRRYAISGPNGAGKSTLMKILTGEIEPTKGSVTRPKKFGVLRQDQFAFDAYSAIDTVIMGNKRLWAAMQERDAIYEKPEITDADGMKLGELEGIVGEEDGYTAESDAAILLQGLDIPDEAHTRKMGELQGGQKVGSAVGAEEFVIFDQGGDADAGGGKRMLDANDARGETDADRIGEGDVGRESQRHVQLAAGRDGIIEIEENAASADVLGFGLTVLGAFRTNDCRQAHVESPHRPPVL